MSPILICAIALGAPLDQLRSDKDSLAAPSPALLCRLRRDGGIGESRYVVTITNRSEDAFFITFRKQYSGLVFTNRQGFWLSNASDWGENEKAVMLSKGDFIRLSPGKSASHAYFVVSPGGARASFAYLRAKVTAVPQARFNRYKTTDSRLEGHGAQSDVSPFSKPT